MTSTSEPETGPDAGNRRAALASAATTGLAVGLVVGVARGLLDGGFARFGGWFIFDRALKAGIAGAVGSAVAARLAGADRPAGPRFSLAVALVASQLAPPVDGETPLLFLFSAAWGVLAGGLGGVSGWAIDRLVPGVGLKPDPGRSAGPSPP